MIRGKQVFLIQVQIAQKNAHASWQAHAQNQQDPKPGRQKNPVHALAVLQGREDQIIEWRIQVRGATKMNPVTGG
jgi:hypothetical protein